MKPFTLYGLKRPNDNVVRYIGITSLSLAKRLREHCIRGSNRHKDNWIAQQPSNPEIVPYAIGLTKEEACDLEIAVIAGLRKNGHPLLNVLDGGGTGMLGKKFTPEHRAKIGAAHMGMKRSCEARANMSAAGKGKKFYPGYGAKMRTVKQGVKLSGEFSSSFVGVYRGSMAWVANIKFHRQTIYIGCFPIEKEAALAYDKKALELFGDKARLNFPPGGRDEDQLS